MQCKHPLWIWICLWLFLAPYIAVLESKAHILYPTRRFRHNKSHSHGHAPNTEEMVNRSQLPILSASFLTAWSLPNPSQSLKNNCNKMSCHHIEVLHLHVTLLHWLPKGVHGSAQLLTGSAAFFGDEVTSYSSDLVTLLCRFWRLLMLVWIYSPLETGIGLAKCWKLICLKFSSKP